MKAGLGYQFPERSAHAHSPESSKTGPVSTAIRTTISWGGEFPMYPNGLPERLPQVPSTRRPELGFNLSSATRPPKLFKDTSWIRQYGCFGCHEINCYPPASRSVPDIGSNRKSGRGRTHFRRSAQRLPSRCARAGRDSGTRRQNEQGWTEFFWVEILSAPSRTADAAVLSSSRTRTRSRETIAARRNRRTRPRTIRHVRRAEAREMAEEYEPDASAGKKLFSQRGLPCLP